MVYWAIHHERTEASSNVQSHDRNILQHLQDWCSEGLEPWLCIITRCVGSSPRPVGSMLVCLDDGRQAGSLSGGCVEEDLLERLRQGEFESPLPRLLDYGLSAEENERLGLPCGGHITVLLQRLGSHDLEWITAALSALAERHCTLRRLSLTDGVSTIIETTGFTPLSINDDELQQCFGPRMRMLLVGAGQLAQSLAELALAMDYEVIVTDPRADALDQWEGPGVPLLQGMPDDILREQASDEHSVIITLTHDPRIDDMALMEALETDAWYVGALGSVRTTQKRLERLRELGLPDEQLARLHAPVGLPIGSKTPIEIAVAIMAQLTQLRGERSRAAAK